MNKEKLEVLIKSGGFDFKSQENILFSLRIPVNILDNMEVLDPLGLEKLINEAISTNNLKPGKIIVYLSNEVIFNKIISSEDEEKKFFDQIPLEPEKIIKNTVTSGKEKIAVAVNKKFISDIKTVLEKIGFNISSIVPETESLQKNLDFNKNLESRTVQNNESADKIAPKNIKIALILFVIAAIAATVLFFFIKKPSVKKIETSQTPQATATETPITFLKKEELKIQILNKTKTSGLAKKTADALSDFPNIQTGNIEGKDAQITDITFSPEVGETEKKEINRIINSMFAEVATNEAELNNGYSILIEIGKPS
jgi:hypothetical protein